MYQFGGSIEPSRYPTFSLRQEPKGRHMLPRQVVKSRPGQICYNMMKQCNWLRQLCKDTELLTIQHLNHQNSQMSEKILQHIYFCKKHIPSCLWICNTFFTQMIMFGSFNCDKCVIQFHVDSDDFITALFSVGGSTQINGGSTFYLQKSVFEGKEKN